MSLIKVEKVQKIFGKQQALADVSLQLEPNKQYVICGASGSGKSTLLYLIGGLDRPDSGKIWAQGTDLAKMTDEELASYRNRFIGFVFQFHFLLPSMDCLGNILLPGRIAGVAPSDLTGPIHELADHLGVLPCLKKYPFELSGGEQQRINIVRAVSLRPKLLLCDEPTGNLDSHNSQKVVDLLRELADTFKATLVVVSHDERVASNFPQTFTLRDGHLAGHKENNASGHH